MIFLNSLFIISPKFAPEPKRRNNLKLESCIEVITVAN